MPSPGRHLPYSPPRGWGRAAFGAFALLVVVTIVWVKMTPDTSLSAGESPEGKQPKAAEPVSDDQNEKSGAPDLSQPEVRGMLPAATALSSASLVGGPWADQAISPIPAVELTAEALTRYIRDRRRYEIRDDYPVIPSPSGRPADAPSSPAIASPAK